MTVSSTFKAAAYQQRTSEALLTLLAIDHDDLPTTLRFVNNGEDVVSGGDTYFKSWFEITFPKRSSEDVQKATIRVCNVDRAIVQAIRSISTRPDVTVSRVLASIPDTIEEGPYEFKLSGVDYDALIVSGTLSFDDIFSEPYPGDTFTPAIAPGLF